MIARILSFVFGAIPFAFGLIRAIQTRRDLRYLWMAIAAFIVAAAIAAYLRSRDTARPTMMASIFTGALIATALVALVLGARGVVGVTLMALGYASCLAMSFALVSPSRDPSPFPG